MQRQRTTLTALTALFVAAFAACGGGGGGGNEPPTSRPDTFYVRVSGDDANSGLSPDQALRTITKAASLTTDGDMVIVGPGTYVGMVDLTKRSGTAEDNRIVLVADSSGAMTGDPEGEVIAQPAQGEVAAFRLTTSQFITIDGFAISGARDANGAGIVIRSNSNNAIVRNCQITSNRDGIRVQDASDVLIFNNLIADNTNRGVRIAATSSGPGSQRTHLVNNTVANNRNAGIVIGDENVASKDTFLRNNIVQNNKNRQIDIISGTPSSVDGYNADFNLVFPDAYGPLVPHGENDINEDAQFVDEAGVDYHLQQGNSPAVDAGDPATDAGLKDALEKRSTSTDGALDDNGDLDLGYHFPG